MYATHLLLALGFLASAVTAAAVNDKGTTIGSRQITSPSIIQSVGFEVDDAVLKHAKISARTAKIFEDAIQKAEMPAATAAKIQVQVADTAKLFTATAWAVGGDLNDAIHRIGDEEAALLKSATDKILRLANTFTTKAKLISEHENKEVLNLLKGDGYTIMTTLRSIFTPIETFVNSSTEDVGFPGALKRAKDDTVDAGKELDALVAKFTPKA